MLVELSYLLLSILIFKSIYNYIRFIINKSSLENEEETYIRLIYNKLLYFKYLTDNEMNMKINEMNMKINEIIDMYKVYLIRFRILNSHRYNEILKIIKKHNVKYLVLQNIKQILNNNNDLYIKINSLIIETNPKYDIENNINYPLFSNNTKISITTI
jgi:hypothetical protein